MPILPYKMVLWLAPVELASQRHGVDRCLLFGVLDRETVCATSPQLDGPGPSGTGDFGPRLWNHYSERPELQKLLKRWQPTPETFRRLFPKVALKEGEPTPFVCIPGDGRGWGRGGFQIDFAGDGTEFGGETNTDFCRRLLPDGRFAWEDPAENANRGALILQVAIEAFGHDEWLACSAYNAGIKHVRHALLSVAEPATPEQRHAAADACTSGGNYAKDVQRRRREFRRLLTSHPKENA